MMNERGKSDPAVVATLANKAGRSVAEPVEPRAGTKGNANRGRGAATPEGEGEVNEARLVRMQREAEPAEPLPQWPKMTLTV